MLATDVLAMRYSNMEIRIAVSSNRLQLQLFLHDVCGIVQKSCSILSIMICILRILSAICSSVFYLVIANRYF